MSKKLYRSVNDKKVCGVCSGVAKYFNLDPTLVRIIYAVLLVFSSVVPLTILYFVLAFVIPEEPTDNGNNTYNGDYSGYQPPQD